MTCKECPKAINCVNGRYCTVIMKYVEHSIKPPCVKNNLPVASRQGLK